MSDVNYSDIHVSKHNITVIAFYPGAGGNRYLRSLLGQEYSTPGVTYDKQFSNQSIDFRWLNGKITAPIPQYCLTHCMNATHIEKTLRPKDIVFIDADLRQSLQRQWCHDGTRLYTENQVVTTDRNQVVLAYQEIKDPSWPIISSIEEFNALDWAIRNETIETMQKNTVPVELESAWEAINWYSQYYIKYPTEFKDYSVVSLNDNTPYTKVMQKELTSYHSEIFNFCWDVYITKGSNAPIIDLYVQHISSPEFRKLAARNETNL